MGMVVATPGGGGRQCPTSAHHSPSRTRPKIGPPTTIFWGKGLSSPILPLAGIQAIREWYIVYQLEILFSARMWPRYVSLKNPRIPSLHTTIFRLRLAFSAPLRSSWLQPCPWVFLSNLDMASCRKIMTINMSVWVSISVVYFCCQNNKLFIFLNRLMVTNIQSLVASTTFLLPRSYLKIILKWLSLHQGCVQYTIRVCLRMHSFGYQISITKWVNTDIPWH